jgi:hypothetical protein
MPWEDIKIQDVALDRWIMFKLKKYKTMGTIAKLHDKQLKKLIGWNGMVEIRSVLRAMQEDDK